MSAKKATQKKRKTRATVMASILKRSSNKPVTKDKMVATMQSTYGGSEAEARYQVSVAVNLLTELGLVKEDDGDKLSYTA
jgi:hypothetical protein